MLVELLLQNYVQAPIVVCIQIEDRLRNLHKLLPQLLLLQSQLQLELPLRVRRRRRLLHQRDRAENGDHLRLGDRKVALQAEQVALARVFGRLRRRLRLGLRLLGVLMRLGLLRDLVLDSLDHGFGGLLDLVLELVSRLLDELANQDEGDVHLRLGGGAYLEFLFE